MLPFSLLLALLPAAAYASSPFFIYPGYTLFYSPMFVPRDSSNLQTFNGTLGGSAPPITNSGDTKRPFEVAGNTFVRLSRPLLERKRLGT